MTKEPTTPLARLAMAGEFKQLEEQWMAALQRGERDLEDFYQAADIAAASGKTDLSGALLGMLLEALNDPDPDERLLDFAVRAALLAIGDPAVRRHAAAIHERAGRRELGILLAPVKGNPGETARERIKLCLRLTPGTYVSGRERVGPERVERFDVDERVFVLTDGESERKVSPENAAGELTLLPPDDFRALLRFEVQKLVKLAEDDPAALVASALRSSKNRLEWQDLKKLMARGVVSQTAFARWWNKAKGLLERHPLITLYGDRQPTLILRDQPLSHEAELRGKLRVAAPRELIQIALGYLGSLDEGHAADAAFLSDLAEALRKVADGETVKLPLRLAAASVFAAVAGRIDPAPAPIDTAGLAQQAADMTDVVAVLQDEDLVRRALMLVRQQAPEVWPALFARTLPQAPGRLTEVLARELMDDKRFAELGAAVQAILKSPERSGEGLFWLFRVATTRSLGAAVVTLDPPSVTLAMLRLMNRLARGAKTQVTSGQKALVVRMRNALSANEYRVMEQLAEQMTEVQARAIYDVVKDNQGLNDGTRHRIEVILLSHHQDAILGRKELWEQDAIYVSPRGLRNREAEFENLVNVEMVKNSAAIGHAAGFGDLSENAEFTAALEQRDFLSRRANEIGQDLRKAVMIPADVPTDKVNVGTRVHLREPGKEELQVYTFLGPWDVDLEQHVYSYLAPFSRAFMGHQVGEVVEVQGENGPLRLEIVAIERAELPT